MHSDGLVAISNGTSFSPEYLICPQSLTNIPGVADLDFDEGPGNPSAFAGFEEKPPAGFALPAGSYYNKYFPGHAIKMPKPLNDGQVTYDDGSPATVAQYSHDVTTFLMWAAEPHMEARKRLGLQVFVFLILFAGLMYFTKKKVWANAH